MIRPLRDLLLVRLLEPEDHAGSIYLPEEAREDTTRDGLVIACGPDVAEGGARVGDRCVMLRHNVRAWVEPEPPKVLVDDEWYTDYVLLWAWAQSRGWSFDDTAEGPSAHFAPDGRRFVHQGDAEDLWEHKSLEAAILQEWSRSRFALVSDADLVAVIPGPAHAGLRAARIRPARATKGEREDGNRDCQFL